MNLDQYLKLSIGRLGPKVKSLTMTAFRSIEISICYGEMHRTWAFVIQGIKQERRRTFVIKKERRSSRVVFVTTLIV